MTEDISNSDVLRNQPSAKSVARKILDFNKDFASEDNSKPIPWEKWQALSSVLVEAASCSEYSDCTKPFHRPLVETFRILRNACAGVVDNAVSVMNQPALVNSVVQLLRHLTEANAKVSTSEASGVVALRCGVQFLGNFVSTCSDKEPVWREIFTQKPSLICKLLENKDEKVRLYSSMLLYNCLSPERCQAFLADMSACANISSLANMMANDNSEWSLFALGSLVQNDFFHHVYRALDLKPRCIVLDIIHEQLLKPECRDELPTVSLSLLEYLSEHFRGRVMDTVKTVQLEDTQGNLGPVEIVKVLDVLRAASIHTSFSETMKGNEPLLEIVVDILKTVHFLGKTEEDNAFSPVQRLDDLVAAQNGTTDMAADPVLGFKSRLVGLIGNLCHTSRRNQDLVRQMEGVPLILDMCNFDAKNPYIKEWAILAVRNLLEDNMENKAVVAGLVRTGVVTDSPLLREMGVQPE